MSLQRACFNICDDGTIYLQLCSVGLLDMFDLKVYMNLF